jgi:hypothetical protein
MGIRSWLPPPHNLSSGPVRRGKRRGIECCRGQDFENWKLGCVSLQNLGAGVAKWSAYDRCLVRFLDGHPEGILLTQSRQSAKLFLQSSELGLPHPLNCRRLCPLPPCFRGEGHMHSLASEGVGESQFRRGNIYCIYTLCL